MGITHLEWLYVLGDPGVTNWVSDTRYGAIASLRHKA